MALYHWVDNRDFQGTPPILVPRNLIGVDQCVLCASAIRARLSAQRGQALSEFNPRTVFFSHSVAVWYMGADHYTTDLLDASCEEKNPMSKPSDVAQTVGLYHDLVIGLDVGSTTVKAVAVDPSTKTILWSDYQRHETRQAEKVRELLDAISQTFPAITPDQMRVFITGSGAGPLVEPLGAKFVQEVNAVTMAVDECHPDVGSVIELGGQDAKIIIYKDTTAGEKRAITSMNDKCASGTGATIDKCIIKVGMDSSDLNQLPWDPSKLHRVAAKCGVFAETDIVNLVKAGIPPHRKLCAHWPMRSSCKICPFSRGGTPCASASYSWADPNTYLPFLQDCWRQRIPETWAARGYTTDPHAPAR